MARSRLADQVGRVVGGRYRLLAPVGTGASADVYVADDVTLRRRVAVKVLHEALATDDGFLRRFRAEARTVASLRHPNIMAVFDWGEDDDGPFLVLEYLGGGSLRDLLDHGHRLSLSQATMIGLEAAHALDHAHRRGLVHRDIKPANLLFDEEGRLAIADFGIARALAEATWTEPVGAVVGTVRYASPEQSRGSSLDGRADVYALALVLVEAVTGSVPFAADTTIATLMARLDRPIPVSDALGPLGPVIEAAGAVDPAERVDAAGLIHALEAAAARLPRPAPLPLSAGVPVGEPTATDRTLLAAEQPQPAVQAQPAEQAKPAAQAKPAEPAKPVDRTKPEPSTPKPPKQPRPRRWRYPWIAVGVIVVALVVALAVFALPGLTPKTYAVPSLTGDTVAQAQAAAHNSHFTVVERDVREGPPFANIHDQNPEPNTRHRAGTITVDVSVGYPFVTVPPLTGDTLAQARAALASVLVVLSDTQPQAFSDSISAGHVISWQPRDNVAQHDTITVTVSGGPEFVSMPSVVGQTLANAESALQNVGITQPPTQVQAFSDTVAAGSVISSDPPAGGTADRAKSPALTVSKGPDVVKVPDVTGDTVEVAEAALRAAGLAPAGPYGPPGADIVDFTAPAAGRKIKRGSTVSLYSNYV